MSGVEKLARALFEWNTPTDPYFVIKGRSGDIDDRDPYVPIVEAILDDPAPLLAALAEAGVLREVTKKRASWVDDGVCHGDAGCPDPIYGPHTHAHLVRGPHSRYVTEWRPADEPR